MFFMGSATQFSILDWTSAYANVLPRMNHFHCSMKMIAMVYFQILFTGGVPKNVISVVDT
jgi:hypothetical protein